ncbi:MAG: hypothetical protein P8Y09_10905, partial [Deltaproteobacteria bacterium]
YLSFRKRIHLALKNSRFRDGRDAGEFSKVVLKMTTKGGVKIAGGIVLIAFSALVLVGSITAATEGDWEAAEYGFSILFTVIPTLIGVILLFSSRKDRVEA